MTNEAVAGNNASMLYADLLQTRGHASPYLESSLKRLLDIVVSLVLIIFLFWLMLAVGILIKLESRGPVIFTQRRNGLHERKITVFKFRSMRHVADSPFQQAARGDRRVTSVGRMIRRTSIDELPQLFNVLAGQMSLVGPRPHPLPLDEQYRGLVDQYDKRFSAVPGMTGIAQVSGARGETPNVASMQRRIDFDNQYVREASFLLDLKILLKTGQELFLGAAHADVF